MVEATVADRIRDLPNRPGIYIFKGERGRVLYVGKAKSLRKRCATYLHDRHEPRLTMMLSEARDIVIVVTDSEAEALLLENNWIKNKRPRYNILLRDDKTYPYLKLTADDYPRLAFTRRIVRDRAEYFGPFLPGGRARKAIKLVQKLFQIRVCRIEIDGQLPRPCLYHDMKRCLGPCVAGLTSREEYASAVAAARLFLSGRTGKLLQALRRQMAAASEKLEFEEAARLRDLILEVELLTEKRKLSSVAGEDVDVYGVHIAGGDAAVTSLMMRGGQVLDRREMFWEGAGEISAKRLLSELLPQIYDRTTFIPKEIHAPEPIDGEAALVEWLGERKGERVYIRYPARGPKAGRVALAMRNSRLAHGRRFRARALHEPVVDALRSQLHLSEAPQRIEGFDISHFQGGETVASMVVWEEGKLRKSDYRSFNIRGLEGPDDFAAMKQAVGRRYRRQLEEVGAMPDLILIDGGQGQLNAALSALVELGVEETPTVALAKREEELYLPETPKPLRLARTDPGLLLLQRIRDEAHRFAVARHRRRRSKRTLTSRLDDLPGIGPKRRKTLLRRFGSVAGVRKAKVEQLQETLGAGIGRQVFDNLHRRRGPSDPVVSTPRRHRDSQEGKKSDSA